MTGEAVDVVRDALACALYSAEAALEAPEAGDGYRRHQAGAVAAQLHKVGTDKAREFLAKLSTGRFYRSDSDSWDIAAPDLVAALIADIIAAGQVRAA